MDPIAHGGGCMSDDREYPTGALEALSEPSESTHRIARSRLDALAAMPPEDIEAFIAWLRAYAPDIEAITVKRVTEYLRSRVENADAFDHGVAAAAYERAIFAIEREFGGPK